MTTATVSTTTIRALIVDDEALSRQRVRRLLRAERDVTVVGECADGAAAVDAIARLAPDIVFLDVQMPELDGFGVLRRLAEQRQQQHGTGGGSTPARPSPVVVFVTAYDQYAIRAFDVHALDYLLKPFTAERFRESVQRARAALAPPASDASAGAAAAAAAGRRGSDARIAALLEQLSAELQLTTGGTTAAGPGAAASTAPPPASATGGGGVGGSRRRTSDPHGTAVAATASAGAAAAAAAALPNEPPPSPPATRRYPDRIAVRDDGRVLFVRVADVDWAEAAGNYVRLHAGRDVHLLRETMAALESALDPTRFVRIHRSAIVAVDRIKELQPWFAGDYVVTLHNGVKLRMSRTYRDNIEVHAGRLSRGE